MNTMVKGGTFPFYEKPNKLLYLFSKIQGISVLKKLTNYKAKPPKLTSNFLNVESL
jgi:hypothetical protein